MLLMTLTPNRLKPPQFLHFALPCLIGDRKDFKFDAQFECADVPVTAYGRQTSLIRAWSGYVTH